MHLNELCFVYLLVQLKLLFICSWLNLIKSNKHSFHSQLNGLINFILNLLSFDLIDLSTDCFFFFCYWIKF